MTPCTSLCGRFLLTTRNISKIIVHWIYEIILIQFTFCFIFVYLRCTSSLHPHLDGSRDNYNCSSVTLLGVHWLSKYFKLGGYYSTRISNLNANIHSFARQPGRNILQITIQVKRLNSLMMMMMMMIIIIIIIIIIYEAHCRHASLSNIFSEN
jgi:hypothetical protein